MAKASGYGESGKKASRNVKVMIEGPYGTFSIFLVFCKAGFTEV
jgi:hypothetical protein